MFFFFGEVLQLGDKKRAGESNKGIFEIKKNKILHILTQKKQKVARFIMCSCRLPKLGRIPKKIY